MTKKVFTTAGIIGAIIIGSSIFSSPKTPTPEVRGTSVAPIETITSIPTIIQATIAQPTLIPTATPTPRPTSTPTPRYIPPTATPIPYKAPETQVINNSGATAECRDGTLSYSAHRSGTCSHHGGVSQWL